MQKRSWFQVACLSFIIGISLSDIKAQIRQNRVFKDNPPNIVIINMDDMGYGDIGQPRTKNYKTPNLDKMIERGMQFSNCYAVQAVCSPSRTALLTGCYPNRLGISGALMPWSTTALNPKEETLAAILKEYGYKTGIVGKWHLGSKPPYWPLRYGFEEFLGLPYSHDMWPVDYDGKPITDSSNWKIKYPKLPLIEADSVLRYIETPEDLSQLTELFTERAVDFIERNKDTRYFLYMAHIMPHVPLAPSPKFKGKSGAGMYGDVMEELDWSVGQVLDKIASTGNNRNTIVIVTSDNGPWLTFGNHAGSAGNLKEAKGTIWDGGVKVPFIIQWPGEIQPGSKCNRFITHLDIMPTLLTVCGARLPKKRIDGVNIGSLLIDPKTESPRREFAYYYDRNCLKAIRSGKWKLVFPHESQTYSKENAIGNDGKPGTYSSANVEISLFDLEADPGETNNMAEQNPKVIESLKNLARKYRSDLGDDLLQTKGANVRPAAVVE